MIFREVFEVNSGFRLFKDDVSLVLEAFSYGERLTSSQLKAFSRIMGEYMAAVKGRAPTGERDDHPLTASSFAPVSDGVFYKYMSPATWEFVRAGSFRFGSANFYREAENRKIRDCREGASSIHVGHGKKQLHALVTSGFNCAILCGTASRQGDRFKKEQFGELVVVIEDLAAFADRVRCLTGARRVLIQDVRYHDLKNFTLEAPLLRNPLELTGRGSLTPDALREVNITYFDLLYRETLHASLFCKPRGFEPEQERRMVIELDADLPEPTVCVNDQELARLVRLAPPLR